MRHFQACSGNKFARLVAVARVVLTLCILPTALTLFIFSHSLYTFLSPFLFSLLILFSSYLDLKPDSIIVISYAYSLENTDF